MERRRKVEFPFYYSPDKKVVHVLAELRDEPGALASLLNTLGGRLNLLGTSSYGIGEGKAIFSGFAETLSHTDTPAAIRTLALGSPSVTHCSVWEDNHGLLVDWFHTGIQTGNGEHYIMLPSSGLVATFEKIVHVFGSGGETILFTLGKEFATSRFEFYRKILGQNAEARVNEVAHIFEALGYGSSTVTRDESTGTMRLAVKECFECSVKTGNGRTCGFTRGLAAGSFGALLGGQMNCEEVACIMKGAPACEFELSAAAS